MKKYIINILFVATTVVLGYGILRENFWQVLFSFSILFAIYFYWIHEKFSSRGVKQWLVFGILIRLCLINMSPNLSDDYYRFVWDAQLMIEGINPYTNTPNNLYPQLTDNQKKITKESFEGLNDLQRKHFTIYPPFNQLLFLIAKLLSFNNFWLNFVMLRALIILFDVLAALILIKILNLIQMNTLLFAGYFLNPLVIIELTGNLHFEGVMVSLSLTAFYFLYRKKWLLGSLFLSFAISMKLVPIIFLPFLWIFMPLKRVIQVGITTAFLFLLGFIPFYTPTLIDDFSKSVGLYFKTFEFNASFYYLFRWIGFQITGWNEIARIGKITPVLVFVILMSILGFYKYKNRKAQFLNKQFLDFFKITSIALLIYFSFQSIVHPWYIITILALSSITLFHWSKVWTFVIVLSYFAYSSFIQENYGGNFHESILYYVLIAIEYFVLIFALVYDYRKYKKEV